MRGKRLLGAAIALVVTLVLAPAAIGARHVYVSNSASPAGANVAGFTLASNGVLQANGALAGSGATSAEGLVMGPAGTTLYAANSTAAGTISLLPVGSDGVLGQGTAVSAGGDTPVFLAMAPDGKHLYAELDGSNTLSVLSVGTNGALTPQSSGITGVPDPSGLAVSPDGKSLYVSDFASGGPSSVVRFAIAADGSISGPAATPTGGTGARQVSLTPDGRYLFALDTTSHDVASFAVNAATGALTPLAGSPLGTGSSDDGTALTVTSDGGHVYAANAEHSISGFNIDPASGALSAAPGSPYATGSGSGAAALAASPDGQRLVGTLESTSQLTSTTIAANGSLSQTSAVPTGGAGPSLGSVVAQPNQGPTAAFTPKVLSNGRVHFNGTASKDPDGKVATYSWNFGDGSPVSNVAKAGTDHTYPTAGTYTATLTAIDNENCSATFVYTGQSALCNGSSVAKKAQKIRSSVQFSITARKLQRHRFVTASVLCPTEACKVNLGGSATYGSGSGKRKLTLKRKRRTLGAGSAVRMRLRLPSRARRALRTTGKVDVRLSGSARASTGLGKNSSRQANVKLRRRVR